MVARRFGQALVVLSLSFLAACASTPRLERYVAMPAGSTYVTSNRDSGSYGNGPSEVSGQIVQRDWQGQTLIGFQSAQGTLLVLPTGGFVGLLAADGNPTVSWSPPLHWEFPIEVGKGWTKQYKVKFHAQNREVPFETKQVVEAYEDVKVPAGTFKTFRIRTSDTLGNENVQWFAPDIGLFVKANLRRTDRHAQGAGTRASELKAVNVKRSSY